MAGIIQPGVFDNRKLVLIPAVPFKQFDVLNGFYFHKVGGKRSTMHLLRWEKM